MNVRALRKGLQTAHLWAGLILCIPFALLGVSGSMLMLQNEIPRLAIPYAPGIGPRQPVDRILRAAQSAAPDGTVPDRIILPSAAGEPAVVRFNPSRYFRRDPRINIFVDPATLKILGAAERHRPAAFFQVMRRLHATLYVRTISNRSFVGWLGAVMAMLLLSGIVLWWPRNRQWGEAFVVRRGASAFRFHRTLHGALGIWAVMPLLIIAVSGIDLAFPRDFKAAVGMILPLGQNFVDLSDAAPSGSPNPIDLDRAMAVAQKTVPNAVPRTIQLPDRPGQMLVMTMAPRGYGAGAPTIMISFDSDAGHVTYIDDPRTYALGERLVLWQRQLHSGLGLGILYRILIFGSGFLPLIFAITGVRMWMIKRTKERRIRLTAVPAGGNPVSAGATPHSPDT